MTMYVIMVKSNYLRNSMYTWVPLPLPGGPNSTALIPTGSEPAGCSFRRAAVGGILYKRKIQLTSFTNE